MAGRLNIYYYHYYYYFHSKIIYLSLDVVLGAEYFIEAKKKKNLENFNVDLLKIVVTNFI